MSDCPIGEIVVIIMRALMSGHLIMPLMNAEGKLVKVVLGDGADFLHYLMELDISCNFLYCVALLLVDGSLLEMQVAVIFFVCMYSCVFCKTSNLFFLFFRFEFQWIQE